MMLTKEESAKLLTEAEEWAEKQRHMSSCIARYSSVLADEIKSLRAQIDEQNKDKKKLRGKCLFYQKRCEILQHNQINMRDPERTLVCDILANCQLLPDPDGKRYGTLKPSLPEETEETKT
jgi:isocitrate dehydrogenase kinase/phosphatase